MPTLVITGANRGIGLELTRHYLQLGWKTIACCRRPDQSPELQQLAVAYPLLSIHSLDVSDFNSIDQFSRSLESLSLDLLINNAGVYGETQGQQVGQIDYADFGTTLRINTLAPIKLTEALLPQLKRSSHALVVSLSSLMGSIADNSGGGSIAYRASKAALNAAMKTLAIDLASQNIGVLILHPGWVKTAMGGPNAPTGIPESVAGLAQQIADYSPERSGHFYNFRGQELPW